VFGWTDTSGNVYFQLVGSPGDRFYINGTGSGSNSTDVIERIERITFDDETVWDLTQGLILNDSDEGHDLYASDANDVLRGNGGNDRIKGFAGDDIIEGGAGRDLLYGGTGDDTYIFEAGFGGSSPDIVYEELNEGTDTIHFGGGITAEDVLGWTDESGNVYLQLAGSPGDQLYINGSGSSANSTDANERVERITFDDETVWDLTQGLILNDSDEGHYLYASDANDTLHGNGGDDRIKGFAGNDIINGGAGRDLMYGGTGDDIYVFEAGFGGSSPDIVYEELNEGTDTIHFAGGITAEDIYRWTDTYGRLYLQLEGTATDMLYFDGDYSSSTGVDVGSYVEYVTFDDATTWDLTQGLHLRNNDTARTLYGSAENDIIEGGAANDTLRGFDGDDWLAGHGGTDALWGYDGADTFAFMLEDVGNGIDTLRDFDMTESDVIDLRDVLDGGYDPMTDALADFVKFTNSGSHAALSVDLDGAGTTYGWTQIATVYNHNNLDADAMVAAGQLLAA
jgi:Ca2+-binding RTX toxin-like protein